MRHRDRKWGLLLLAGMLLLGTGCASTPFSSLTEPRTSIEAQVFLKPAFVSHQRSRLVIFPFTQPRHAPGTGHVVTHEFYQELLRSGLYRQIVVGREIPNDPQRISQISGLEDSDLAMRGKIVNLLAGSGNTPSQLTVEIQVMTASTGTLVWFVRLDASSETGADVDLVWHTYEGQGAHRYQTLARTLAQQLVKVLTPPPETETPSVPIKSPLSREAFESGG